MSEADQSLASSGLAGITGDARRRWATYGSDWRDGLHPKVPAAALFLFFACLAPAIAFGGMLSVATAGAIGVVEMIAATAACGVVYAILAGQPLTILGGTGPLLVFTALLYELCTSFSLPFLPVYGWVGLWTALFLVVLAVTGASRWIGRFTRFTDEIFSALISLIFVVQAVTSVARAFPANDVADDSALFGLVLAVGTFVVASALARLRHSVYLRARYRELLADFGPAVAVMVMVFVRKLLPGVHVAGLAVPTTLGTTSGRGWLVPLGDLSPGLILATAVPALLVTLLLYLDQNITVRIVQNPENGLKKGAAYHWDLGLVGLLVGACSVVGLPWLVAATVRSVNHVRALELPAEGGVKRTIENRLSPLLIHAGIGAALFATGLLRQVPMPVLYGLFLYMGITSMRGNQLFERLRLWLMDPQLYPDHHYVRLVPSRTLHAFTAVQVACLAALWVVKSSRAGIVFPVLIALLVPVRTLLDRWFSAPHLAALNGEEHVAEAEDDLGS